MRVLRVHHLASELNLLPGDLNVMITLGRMAGLAQSINVLDDTSRVEISSAPEGFTTPDHRNAIKSRLEVELRDYFYVHGSDRPDIEALAELCLSILDTMPPKA